MLPLFFDVGGYQPCSVLILQVVQFLYERAPEAVEAKCFAGMLPLHCVAGSAATLGERNAQLRYYSEGGGASDYLVAVFIVNICQ